MAETTVEFPLPKEKVNPSKLKFTINSWCHILGKATLNWYQNQDAAIKTKKTGELNQMASDETLSPKQRAQAQDIVYARGVLAITTEPASKWFYRHPAVTIEKAIGKEGILFMLKNLPFDNVFYPYFQQLASQDHIEFQSSFDKPQPSFPKPAFMTAAVKKWERGEV